jgi:UDP-N-acetylmuramate: L-alanyl-gamma-D-glutamyl-meso-diaminopimelate ligase
MNKKGHIHIIGICGVATSALAIAFHKDGWRVTGSDKGFYPPVSTELEKAGIDFYAGWHPENILMTDKPDFVIAGTASGTQNPETAYAKEANIPIHSDAEIRGKYFAKKNSIVCAGTWGKTSSTALLSHILTEAHKDPSYVIGGISLSTPSAHLGSSDWSVIEGDEYKSSPWDNSPKFSHLKATHILLTAISWDHADLYPTEKDYFNAFEKLVHSIPHTGKIIANGDAFNVSKIMSGAKAPIVFYGHKNGSYLFSDVVQTKKGLEFFIKYNGFSYHIKSPMIGAFQAENIAGCFAMAHEIGIPASKIIDAIASFKGLKRRLEVRYSEDYFVFDDIAHSPEKAYSAIETVKNITSGKVIAVYEPNIGSRKREITHKYDNAFKFADMVIIPRLTKLKINANPADQTIEGQELTDIISKTHANTKYIDDDESLISFIEQNIQKGDSVIFLGAHGFRGMIDFLIEKLSHK